MRGATKIIQKMIIPHRISIHAPHAGRDKDDKRDAIVDALFQSTRPMRGATGATTDTAESEPISIHAPHAGRDDLRVPLLQLAFQISIHAPHAGRDSKSIQNYFTHFCDKRQFLDNFTQNAAF